MTQREMFFKYLGIPSSQPLGLEIVKAEGIYLYDSAGNRYIDFVSGISVSNVGHRHPEIIDAIRKQVDHYLHLNVYGEFVQSPQVNLAKELVSALPEKLNSVYFVNSGSEAIEGAIKLAKRFTGRTEIIAFNNSYHGSTMGALSILGNESLKNSFRPLIPDIRFLKYNNVNDLNDITTKTACVVAETIQAEAGIILPDKDFVKKLQQRCTETGALLVIDDVQMGFGRTGKLFSYENFGIIPDILVLAKAMGGGMPIGAFISPKEVMDTLTCNPELGHITTFGGHPVSCASALASLKVIIRGDLLKSVEAKGKMICEKINNHSLIKEIRRIGLALGVEIKDVSLRKQLTNAALKNGVITFRIAPPLTITHEEIEDACNRLMKSLDESFA
jgi:acetylornithine/succinyldiaminopimelate/putrescine aminotransferase